VLGWYLSEDRKVARFSDQLYASALGVDALRYTLPAPLAFIFDQQAQRQAALDVVETLREIAAKDDDGGNGRSKPSRRPVIAHMFSGNGYIIYQHIADVLAEQARDANKKPHLELHGAVIDSAPVPWTFSAHFSYRHTGHWGLNQDPNPAWAPVIYGYMCVAEEKLPLPQVMKKYWSLRKEFQKNWKLYAKDYYT